MKDSYPDICPYLYECTHIRKAPTIRALLGCSAEEAMKSICATCPDRLQVSKAVEGAEALAVKPR
jgi:hypothetical protein